MKVPAELTDTLSFYTSRGFGSRVGFGEKPAIVVVDLINAFTDPDSPLGSDLSAQIGSTSRVLEAARAAGALVVFSTVAYDANLTDAEAWMRKVPASGGLIQNTPAVEVDTRMGKRDDEHLVVKKFASCFFGTDLATRLVTARVDTVIIAGCTTSGCVRATAIDAFSYGFRTIVVEDAVGDRAELPHYVNLFDIDAKYGDVVDEADAIGYLNSLRHVTRGP